MKGIHQIGALCAVVLSIVTLSSHAALIPKFGGDVVYDDDRNITWLANANLAASNTFGLATGVSLGVHPDDTSGVNGIIHANGTMNWPGALFWIDAMNDNNYLGFNDWRLPLTLNPDGNCTNFDGLPRTGPIGFTCTGSEMPHLFTDELVADAATSVFDSGDPAELAKFTNIQSYIYWSGTEYEPSRAWYFGFFNGYQNIDFKSNQFNFAWAVRSGDVSAAPKSSLLGDEVNACLNRSTFCSVPLTNGGVLNSSGMVSATVIDPGVEFTYGSGFVESADFTADTLTISIKNISGGLGLSGNEVWAFDNLNWSGTQGVITGLVEQPGGNLSIVSTDFGDDYIVIDFRQAYFSGEIGQEYKTTFKISGISPPPIVDADDDGIPDAADNCPAIPNLDQSNSDGDIAGDACDVCPLDPSNDADGDGVCGDIDNCPIVANPGQEDADSDGFGDACNAAYDADGDEWSDSLDNCPSITNPGQVDVDSDGIGDVCDVCPNDPYNDAEGDGYCADTDNCPLVNNPDQADTDSDGQGNACDVDDDSDGVSDLTDNCPLVANADQQDLDMDSEGDACDLDADGDMVTDAVDACPRSAYGEVANASGCTVSQLCPAENAWKNHGAYVACVTHEANDFNNEGLITDDERKSYVSKASESDIGH